MTVSVSASCTPADVARAIAPLKAMDQKIQRRVLPKIARAGGKPQLAAMKQAVPKRSGIFKRSHAQKTKRYGGTALSISGQKKGAKYPKAKRKPHSGISASGSPPPAHLVLGATQAHTIPGRVRFGLIQTRGKALKAKAMTLPNGFRKFVRHPGKRKNDAYEVAFRRSQGPALAASAAIAKHEIEIEANLAKWD